LTSGDIDWASQWRHQRMPEAFDTQKGRCHIAPARRSPLMVRPPKTRSPDDSPDRLFRRICLAERGADRGGGDMPDGELVREKGPAVFGADHLAQAGHA